MIELNADKLKEILSELCKDFNLLSAAVLNLNKEKKQLIIQKLTKIYRADNPSIASEYIFRTLARRINPFAERIWANSYLCIAVPVEIIPKLELNIPPCDKSQELYLASYAGQLDYHIFCTRLIEDFLYEFSKISGFKLKSETCVDAKAIPEKILAKFAKLGEIAFNGCLICNKRTDFFIASAFLDIELPSVSLSENSQSPCENCRLCLKKCPTGALQEGKSFNPNKCISFLTMEKKGELSSYEKSIIGKNIFGCDICTNSCPKSVKKERPALCKDWLNSLSQKQFKSIFAKSPILYAGLKKLKRNANP